MRGTRSFTSIIDWPYREGLRMDEAMHPLTLMTVGLYGKTLLNQSGAPLRLIVPWKYGFKNIKSIVEINITDRQPNTSWQDLAPQEYGFYANVNPEVSHRLVAGLGTAITVFAVNPNRVRTQCSTVWRSGGGPLPGNGSCALLLRTTLPPWCRFLCIAGILQSGCWSLWFA